MKRQTGTVKWYNHNKGYGFITYNEKDVFVHYRNILGENGKSLREGQIVEFILVNADQCPAAKQVSVIEEAS